MRSNQAVAFLRVVRRHHIQLSTMAHFKAIVRLGASFLIFTSAPKKAMAALLIQSAGRLLRL